MKLQLDLEDAAVGLVFGTCGGKGSREARGMPSWAILWGWDLGSAVTPSLGMGVGHRDDEDIVRDPGG